MGQGAPILLRGVRSNPALTQLAALARLFERAGPERSHQHRWRGARRTPSTLPQLAVTMRVRLLPREYVAVVCSRCLSP